MGAIPAVIARIQETKKKIINIQTLHLVKNIKEAES
jgi:hypothetical protein